MYNVKVGHELCVQIYRNERTLFNCSLYDNVQKFVMSSVIKKATTECLISCLTVLKFVGV